MAEDPDKKVTPEDARLFREAIGDVRPVTDERVQTPKRRPRPVPRPRQFHGVPLETTKGFSTSDSALDDTTGESLSFIRSGIQTRVLRRLKRGQVPIEDKLDLHGMNADEASQRLGDFLLHAHQQGRRGLLVVHGKGRGSGHGGPRLKSLLNRWLRLRPEVVAFCTAQPRHGGTGALYVLLNRDREL